MMLPLSLATAHVLLMHYPCTGSTLMHYSCTGTIGTHYPCTSKLMQYSCTSGMLLSCTGDLFAFHIMSKMTRKRTMASNEKQGLRRYRKKKAKMFDDESQEDRLTTLPPELLEHIFRLISDPKDMIRCLLVNRRIAEAVQISFKNIRSLSIDYDNLLMPLLRYYSVNDSEVRDITAVVRQLWDRAGTITALQLYGKWDRSLHEVLLPRSLEDGLRYSPHDLTELELELNFRDCHTTRSNLVQYIVKVRPNRSV